MGMRLLPLTVQELCVHALELERDCASRYALYGQRMRQLEAGDLADLFEDLCDEAREAMVDLEERSGGRRLAELSPWEYAWRLTYCPDAMRRKPRLVPMSAREALQLALMSGRRSEDYLGDVVAHARDRDVREHAAKLLDAAQRNRRRLESRLAGELQAAHRQEAGRSGEAA